MKHHNSSRPGCLLCSNDEREEIVSRMDVKYSSDSVSPDSALSLSLRIWHHSRQYFAIELNYHG